MKSDLMILLRVNFQMIWGSMRYSKRRKKFIPLTLLALAGGLIVLAVMTLNAVVMTQLFIEQGTPHFALYFNVAQGLLVAIFTAVVRGGMSNTSTDADLLLSLPLRREIILLSKSLSRYLFDLILIAAMMLPGIVVYFIMADHSLWLLLRGLLSMLMTPLCSVGIAYILSYTFFKFGGLFRRPEIMRTGLMLAVTLAFMVAIMGMSGSMGMGVDLSAIVQKFPPLAWGAEFAVFGGLVKFLLYTLVTALPFGVGVLLQASIYGQRQSSWRSKDKTLGFPQHSPMRALFGKEIRFYFSIPIYVMNTIFGPAMALAGVVALLVARDAVMGFLLSDPDIAGLADQLPIVLLTVFSFFPAMTCITASSISLEGKNIRILRSSPVRETDVFLSKILVHLVVSLPAFLLCALACGWAVDMNWLDSVLLTLVVGGVTVFTAVWGLYINLLLPKMQWDNETQVVKQSMAMMVTMFSNWIVMFLPLGLFYLVGQRYAEACLLSVAVLTLLTLLIWVLLSTDGKKRYREL